jgi:HK97 family phage prohead protease
MVNDLERRAAADVGADGRLIRGYAIVFNTLSADLGGFREIITPEAVDRTLRERLDVRALVDHDPSKVLGRTTAGTLTLRKDAHGLHVEINPPDTTAGRDTLESIGRRDVNGMSFTFQVVRPGGERFERRDSGLVRIVSDMTIQEVSVVTFPAYAAADVAVAQRALRTFQAGQTGRPIAWLRMRHTASGV